MQHHLRAIGAALVVLTLSALPALAQETPAAPQADAAPKKALNPLLDACLKPAEQSAVLIACTTAIESRQLQGEELAAALYRRGLTQGMRGKLPAAINDFSAALKQTPEATDVLYARASTYGAMKRHDLAIADYDALLKEAPKDTDSLYRRAWSLSALGRDDKAIADLTAVLAEVRGDVDALMDRGGLYLRQGAFDKAAADFSAIIKADPKAAAAFYNRGRARSLAGDPKAAAKDFAEAATLRSDNPYAALRRYLAAQASGTAKANAKILTEAMAKFQPEQWPVPILTTLAGQMPEKDLLAATSVRDQAAARRLEVEAHYYLGEAALLKKDQKAAKAHFAAAAKGDRGIPEAVDAGWRLKQMK